MKNLKLTIDLLPKGAWGKDFSITLPKKDWDRLRYATYEVAEYQCEICGTKPETLKAHEVWDFDIPSQTHTLVEIKDTLTKHYLEAESLFEQRNQVKQWQMKAPLLEDLGISY